MWTIESIQVAQPQVISDGEKTWETGIDKKVVSGPIQVHSLGLEGDGVGDRLNHGGVDKALCCHPKAHYEYWNAYFDWDLPAGAFGENLTLLGLTEAELCIGDILQVGSATFQVSQPRIPCWKQSHKLKTAGFEKLTTQTGRSGFYLRVLETGQIQAGERIQMQDRPHPKATIVRLNRAFLEKTNLELLAEFAELPALSAAWQEMFQRRLG